MIDGIFGVSPPGLCGMNGLAVFLNELRRTGAIADWHPMRAVSGSGGAQYAVQFEGRSDVDHATRRWKPPVRGIAGNSVQNPTEAQA